MSLGARLQLLKLLKGNNGAGGGGSRGPGQGAGGEGQIKHRGVGTPDLLGPCEPTQITHA